MWLAVVVELSVVDDSVGEVTLVPGMLWCVLFVGHGAGQIHTDCSALRVGKFLDIQRATIAYIMF